MTRGSFVAAVEFPEGLRWHDGELWFSDLMDRRVWSVDPEGRRRQRAFVIGMPSGLGWLDDGALLVSSMISQQVLAISGESRQIFASLEEVAVGAVNDMLVHRGRVYLGSLGYHLASDPLTEGFAARDTRATLIMVDESGQAKVVADGLACPNGIAITADGGTLVVAETYVNRLTAFDVAGDGSLSNQRVFAELDGSPDGICMDSEGAVWAAMMEAGRFQRVRDGGELLEAIEVPGRAAIDCTLGGADGRMLFGGMTYGPPDPWTTKIRGEIAAWQVDVPGGD